MPAPQSGEQPEEAMDHEEDLLDEAEAAEEIDEDDHDDHPMDSENDDEEAAGADGPEPEETIQLQNDSIAHFDGHNDSIFAIAQHPTNPQYVVTGGGDDITYIWSSRPPSRPLPASYESTPAADGARKSLEPVAKLTGHRDSINALAFSLPSGDLLFTGGLDGQLRVYHTSALSFSSEDLPKPRIPFLTSAQEVPEINFLLPCPRAHPGYPDNTVALGASDGSVWIYALDPRDKTQPLQVLQAWYLHTGPVTAGAWTPDGNLLATVSEDGSLYVWDPFATTTSANGTVVALTAEDQRFAVEGGLYSLAIAPSGAFVAVGGAGGMIRVVGLPQTSSSSTTKTKGNTKGAPGAGQAGQILASLAAQTDGVESLSFSPASSSLTLLAAGSVDGSIALFDHAHRFTLRRHIKDAHEGYAVVKVDFGTEPEGHMLTTCGLDGVVKRWNTRGGTAAGAQGLVREWKGHRGEGEGGGVLGFVVQSGQRKSIVTAGDDGVALVFDA